jgi:hypothetical protein
MAGPFKARQIIEEDQFREEKIRISRSVKRLDDILLGITWVLARKPESFEQVGTLDLYLAKTDAVPPGVPALYIWFWFDDDAVHLLSIEHAPRAE